MADYCSPTHAAPWNCAQVPDFGHLWHVTPDSYFGSVFDGAKNAFFQMIVDAWPWLLMALTLFMALTFLALLIRKFRWGPADEVKAAAALLPRK